MYLWIKTLHVVAIISWMAALLYLPRLFVYHVEAGLQSDMAKTFVVMERRLLRAIMTPSMIVVWLTGIALAVEAGFFKAGWLHGKLVFVLILSGMHGYLAAERKRLEAGTSTRTSRYFRFLNEVPAVLMLLIVGLVIIKPF